MHFCEVDDECRLDLDHLRVAALGAHASRRVSVGVERRRDGHARRRDRRARARRRRARVGRRGALRPARADRRAGRGADVLVCSPYKFYGPHLGLAYVRRELAERWRPYKVRPAERLPVGHRFETGTLAHELLAGFVAVVEYLQRRRLGLHPRARARARAAVPRRAARAAARCTAIPTMDARVPTFAFNARGRVARRTRPRASASAASPSGRATTTRSRS